MPSKGQLALLVALLLLMAAALALRLPGLGAYHFSGDDCLHIERALAPTLWGVLRTWDTHPPLYSLLLRGLLAVVPPAQPLVPKLLALTCGVALVPAAYLLGRVASGGPAGGLMLALLATVSSQLVLHSQDVRHYTLLVLLEVLLLCSFLGGRRGPAYFLLAALVLATHFASALLIATTGLAGLLDLWRARAGGRRLAGWLCGHALLCAFWAGMVALVPGSFTGLEGWMHNTYLFKGTLAGDARLWMDVETVLSGVHLDSLGPAPWSLSLFIAAGTAELARRRACSMLLIAYLPLLATLVLSALGRYPLAEGRWCLWLVPGLMLPMAAAPGVLRPWLGRAADAVAPLGLAALLAMNLIGSPRHGVLSPDRWRRTDHLTPTLKEQRGVWRELSALGPRQALILSPLATRFRIEIDEKLGWGVPGVRPNLVSCPGMTYESFTPEELLACLHGLGPSAGREVWFLQGKAEPVAGPSACLPILETHRVGRFVLVAVDLPGLRKDRAAVRCWQP